MEPGKGTPEVARIEMPLQSGVPVLDGRAVRLLIDELTALDAARPRAAVLVSEAEDFCVGGDHDEAQRLGSDGLRALLADIARLEQLLRASAFPIVGLARGRVIGGGVELLLACDLILAVPGASFSTPHVRGAARLGPGLTGALVARIGSSWARRMLLLQERVDAETAARIGLVDRLVEGPDGWPGALDIASTLGAQPARPLARAREDLDRAELSVAEALGRSIDRLRS